MGCLWTKVKQVSAILTMTCVSGGQVLPSQLTQGLEYYALKNDQVLGLLQVGLRLRGQARYSLGGLDPLSNILNPPFM